MNRPVLFLDIDGVLNSKDWALKSKTSFAKYNIDPIAVQLLADILKETGASVVISSSWKFKGMEWLNDLWREIGLPGKILGLTPNTDSDDALLEIDDNNFHKLKGLEIRQWLSKHPTCANYAIIDDEEIALDDQRERFVKTDPQHGLTEENKREIIEALRGRYTIKQE